MKTYDKDATVTIRVPKDFVTLLDKMVTKQQKGESYWERSSRGDLIITAVNDLAVKMKVKKKDKEEKA